MMEPGRHGVAFVAMALFITSLAGCASSAESAEGSSTVALPTSTAATTTTGNGDTPSPSDVTLSTAADISSTAGTIISAEVYFAACLDVAGIAHDGSVWAQLPPPSNAPEYVPTEPTAVFGPPGESWWAVLFAQDAAGVLGGLIYHVPTGLVSNPRGRMLRVGAATDGGVAADASAAQQAAATVIQSCSLEAIGGEAEIRQLPGS